MRLNITIRNERESTLYICVGNWWYMISSACAIVSRGVPVIGTCGASSVAAVSASPALNGAAAR